MLFFLLRFIILHFNRFIRRRFRLRLMPRPARNPNRIPECRAETPVECFSVPLFMKKYHVSEKKQIFF